MKAATDFFFAACLSIYWEKNLTIAEDMTDAVSSTLAFICSLSFIWWHCNYYSNLLLFPFKLQTFLQRAFRNVVCVSNVKLWPNFVLLLHFEMKRTQVLYVIYLRFATILPPLFPTEKKTSVIILPRCVIMHQNHI